MAPETAIDTERALERLLVSTNPPSIREDLVKMINATSALIVDGHFALKSGLHSNHFIQFSALAKRPSHVLFLAKTIASQFSDLRVDCVVVPNTAGAVLAYEVALALKAKLAFVTLDPMGYPSDFMSNFEVPSGERVLIILDVITTGQSLANLHSICRRHELIVVGAAAFANRGYVDTADLEAAYPGEKLLVLAEFKMDHAARPCQECVAEEPVTSFWELQG